MEFYFNGTIILFSYDVTSILSIVIFELINKKIHQEIKYVIS